MSVHQAGVIAFFICDRYTLSSERNVLKTGIIIYKGNLLGMVAYACNPLFERLEQENYDFEDSLGYIGRPYLKRTNFQNLTMFHMTI